MEPAVVVRDLRKRYGEKIVLDGVDLEIPRGIVYALLGANGAGKTTLIHILTTLVAADAGTAEVAGADVVRQARAVHDRISLTGQFAAVDEVLTGAENLRMTAALLGVPRRERDTVVGALLDRFDLADAADRPARTYSGGMRRRLDLAISLVRTPEVLFLDEPTTGLDTRSRQELWTFIGELAGHGVTVVLTTQYLEEADALADRVGVLHGGRIVAEGTPADLKASVGSERLVLLDAGGGVVAEHPTDGTLAGLRRAVDSLDADGGTHAQLRRPTLDDVFLSLTTRSGAPVGAAPVGAAPVGAAPVGPRVEVQA